MRILLILFDSFPMILNSFKVLCPRRRKKKNEKNFMGKIYPGYGGPQRVAKGRNYLKMEKETTVGEGGKSIYFLQILTNN